MNETHYQMDLLKAMNRNLSARDRMYQIVCEMTDGAYLYFDADKNEVVTIGKWSEFFDFEIKEKRDLEKLYDLVDEPYVAPLRELIHLEKAGQERAKLELTTRKKDTWFQFQAIALYDVKGNLTDKVIGVLNITKFKLQSQELDYYSFYDVITGLYNRNYFIRLLGESIQKAKTKHKKVSVMMIDVDDFHKINDGLGMVYGDELIIQFGNVLKELCNENLFACHLNMITQPVCVLTFTHFRSASTEKTVVRLPPSADQPVTSGASPSSQDSTVPVGASPAAVRSITGPPEDGPTTLATCKGTVLPLESAPIRRMPPFRPHSGNCGKRPAMSRMTGRRC